MYKVVVLGGGFAGVTFAKKILSLYKGDELKVILVDRNDYQCIMPTLPSFVFERDEIVIVDYEKIFKNCKNFSFVKGEISGVNVGKKEVYLNGEVIKYDELVLSFGVEPNDFRIEGVKENALMFYNERDLKKYVTILDDFIKRKVSPKVLVVGAGSVGVELASQTSHLIRKYKMLPDISILEAKERCLPTLPEPLSKSVEKYLLKNNIKIFYNSCVSKVSSNVVYCNDDKKYSYDILVWSAGVKLSSLVEKIENLSGIKFEKGAQGRILVDEYLRVKGIPNLWAIGDIAFPENQKVFPMQLAQFAIQMGSLAAQNVINSIQNKPMKKLNLSFKGIVLQFSRYKASAIIEKPFRIVIPPSILGVFIRKFVDYNYLFSLGLRVKDIFCGPRNVKLNDI